jgi:acetyl-CoA synthetase
MRCSRGQLGRVAIRVADSPLVWFTGYANAADTTAERFSAEGHCYLTGDAGSTDGGLFLLLLPPRHIVIIAGSRISPFDVGSVLVMHPRVIKPSSSACRTPCAARCSKP